MGRGSLRKVTDCIVVLRRTKVTDSIVMLSTAYVKNTACISMLRKIWEKSD